MAKNIIWSDTWGEEQLQDPFVSYIIEPYTRRFADWMLGITEDERLNKRFGDFTPKNLISTLKSDIIVQDKTFLLEVQQEQREKLVTLQKNLENQAKKLYDFLGCKDFDGFYQLWKGQSSNKSDEDSYWLNKHLELLIGHTQHIATSKGFTLIEQLLVLSGVELQSVEYEGFSAEERRKIKKILENENILKEIEDVHTRWGDKKVYIPEKKNGAYPKDNDFLDTLEKFYTEKVEHDIDEDIKESFKILGEVLSKVKEKRERNVNSKGEKFATVDSMFVKLNFRQVKRKSDQVRSIVGQLMKYFKKARMIAFNKDEYNNWIEYNKIDGKGDDFIKKKFIELCQDFFRLDKNYNFLKDYNTESSLMGFFGELYTHGKSYFNLKDKNVKVYSTGRLLDLTNKKELAADTVLVVNNQTFGIQTKNPYQTVDGIYRTYVKKFTLDSDELFDLYLRTDDTDFRENFQHLNLNVNNTTNPEVLKKNIEAFLYAFSPNFLRVQSQQIDGIQDLTKEVQEDLDTPIQNVFFVVRGELIESASIIKQLIAQYDFFIENVQEWRKQRKNSIWEMKYENDIPKNLIRLKAGESLKYKPAYVKSKNLLSNISISTAVNIKVPAMNAKEIKRIKL